MSQQNPTQYKWGIYLKTNIFQTPDLLLMYAYNKVCWKYDPGVKAFREITFWNNCTQYPPSSCPNGVIRQMIAMVGIWCQKQITQALKRLTRLILASSPGKCMCPVPDPIPAQPRWPTCLKCTTGLNCNLWALVIREKVHRHLGWAWLTPDWRHRGCEGGYGQ